jgi:hypothetical protein
MKSSAAPWGVTRATLSPQYSGEGVVKSLDTTSRGSQSTRTFRCNTAAMRKCIGMCVWLSEASCLPLTLVQCGRRSVAEVNVHRPRLQEKDRLGCLKPPEDLRSSPGPGRSSPGPGRSSPGPGRSSPGPVRSSAGPGPPLDPVGAPLDPFGAPLDPVGAPLDPFGAPLDPFGAQRDQVLPWARSELSWTRSGLPWTRSELVGADPDHCLGKHAKTYSETKNSGLGAFLADLGLLILLVLNKVIWNRRP